MPYYVDGKEFSSSVLAQAASPGGYTRTVPNKVASSGWGGTVSVDPVQSALQRAMAYYKPGGGFGKGVEAAIGRSRKKALALGMQSLVSAGLAGTTVGASLGKKFEEEVAMPILARVEEERARALSGLELTGAQFAQSTIEAEKDRSLQTYLAQLSGPTISTTSPVTQQPVIRTEQPSYKFPTAPSLISSSGYLGIPGVSSIPPEKMPVMGYTTEELKKYERLGW